MYIWHMIDLPSEVAPGVAVQWNTAGEDKVIDTLYFHGGIFGIDHQLPPVVETATILGAAGLGRKVIGNLIGRATIDQLTEHAYNAFNVPRSSGSQYSVMRSLIGRLCLPGSILKNLKPAPLEDEPDSLALQILSSLGEGRGWDEVRAIHDLPNHYLWRHMPRRYNTFAHKKLNPEALILHGISAGALDPAAIVKKQGTSVPEFPLAPITHRWQKRANQIALPVPERFQPFEDTDKIISVEKPGKITHIEACGAVLEVNDTDIITNKAGKKVLLTPQHKLALLTMAMGGSRTEAAETSSLALIGRLHKKLGVSPGPYGFTEATLLTCRELLSPVTPPEWLNDTPPDFSWVNGYIGGYEAGGVETNAQDTEQEQYRLGREYALDLKFPYCSINLMLLLGYADDRIPRHILQNNTYRTYLDKGTPLR